MDAYVLIVLNGLTFASVGTMPMDQCEVLRVAQPTTTCVAKEPDCGKGAGVPCLGRADLDEAKPTAKKRRTYRTRTVRMVRR